MGGERSSGWLVGGIPSQYRAVGRWKGTPPSQARNQRPVEGPAGQPAQAPGMAGSRGGQARKGGGVAAPRLTHLPALALL